VIDGDEEARLIALARREEDPPNRKSALIVDLGGGRWRSPSRERPDHPADSHNFGASVS